MTNYDIFPSISRINTVLQHSIYSRDELRILKLSTHTNRVFDFVTPN